MRKLTPADYVDAVQEKHGKALEVLSEYTSSREKVHVRCLVCKHEWFVAPRSLFRCGCPECGKKTAAKVPKWNLSQEDFMHRIPEKLREEILVLGKYTTVDSPIEVECKTCKSRWFSKPSYLYRGHGCSQCGHERKGAAARLTHEEFLIMVQNRHGNSIEVHSLYETGAQDVDVKCCNCGHKWAVRATNLTGKHFRGCPNCAASKGEKKITRILDESGILYLREVTFPDLRGTGGGLLRFDFQITLPNGTSRLVEFDGLYHFQPYQHSGGTERLARQKQHDQIKNEYCRINNLELIRIPFTKMDQITLEYLTT